MRHIYIASLVIVAMLAAVASSSAQVSYVTQWGGQFTILAGVDVDNNGHVLVTDHGGSVCVFGDRGSPVNSLLVEDSDLSAACYDNDGNIYVVHSDGWVLKYSATGVYLKTIGMGTLQYPFDVEYNPSNGRIYVSDQGHNRICMFTPEGGYLGAITGLAQPYGMDFDAAGNLYVVVDNQYNNCCVAIISPAVTLLKTVGVYGSGDGQFNHPRSVAVGPTGQFVVADYGNNRAVMFDNIAKGCGFLLAWGATSEHPFRDPSGVAIDNHNFCYIVQSGSKVVQVWGPLPGAPVPVLKISMGQLKVMNR